MSRLIWPYRRVVHTGSHQTTAAAAHSVVRHRSVRDSAGRTSWSDNWTRAITRSRFPAVASVRITGTLTKVSGTNNRAANGG